MSLIDDISDPICWAKFYDYKTSLSCTKKFSGTLRTYIDDRRYVDVARRIREGEPFPLPSRRVISKMSSQKKRTVYTYPEDENIVLKLLTHLMLRKYDTIYTPNLYSFRPDKTVKDAIRYLTSVEGIDRMYSYKVDISNYFNSIPVERLMPVLKSVLNDDPALFDFLSGLLIETRVTDKGAVIEESKGIMAGTPQASFYADLYLKDMDRMFYDRGIPYARYSDDIIVFADSREKIEEYADIIREQLGSYGLSVNQDKESYGTPDDGWVFLGFSYNKGFIDIAPASLIKIKAKMRRKTRALKRWQERGDEAPERAAAAFIRIFDRKLFEQESDNDLPSDNDLTWSKWYFPVINTVAGLRQIDHYAQECVRYLLTSTRSKARYRVKYKDIKDYGLRSLVNEYYKTADQA